MGRRTDRVLTALARLALAVFFRRLEVEGADRLPPGRPLVAVANHVNGLVDPVLLVACLPAMPRFLGKSTLWEIAPLRPLLDAAGVIPVYRRRDRVDTAGNVDTFARCHRLLADGGTIALFPEGTSHSEPGLLPLKTGAARIVLEAEARFGAPGAPLGVRVVPVGLVFDAKQRFRSRALVRIGEPIDPLAVVGEPPPPGAAPDESGASVRALTAAIEAGLSEVTLSFATWQEARRIARATEIWSHPDLELPTSTGLAEGFDARRAFLEGYREFAERHPERVHSAAEAVAAYDRLLAAAGVRDRQVAARYPAPSVVRSLARTLGALALGLPAAAVGTALNWLPYRAVGLVARRVRELPDQQATYKMFPALAAFPLAWLAEAAAAGWLAARWAEPGGWAAAVTAGVLTALAAPLSGFAALRFHDRRRRLQAEVRAFLVLRTRRRLADELRRRREAVYRQVAELVDLYRRDAPDPPPDARR